MAKAKSSRSRKRAKRSNWITPLILFLVAFIPTLWAAISLFVPLSLPTPYELEVKKGDTLNGLSERLADENVLRDAFWVKVWLRVQHRDSSLVPGIFLINERVSAVDLLKIITEEKPKHVLNRITVVEGTTFKDLLGLLERREDVTSTLKGKSPEAILLEIGSTEKHPEGLFAPDTYQIKPFERDIDILKRLYEQQQKVLEQEWETRADGLPYKTPYEALIMASIVEKETGVAYERAEIAGVFVRRLEKGMRLQTDPTVIYGMGDNYKGKISRRDLRTLTPYNTYRIDGLPPTPIALPGRAAIRAALNPAQGKALFFVARGDGSHVFSETLAEHNAAVRQYQLKRAADYRSSPAP